MSEETFDCPNCGNTVPSGDECWGVCSVCFSIEGDEMRTKNTELRTQLSTALTAIDEALALHRVCTCGEGKHCVECDRLTYPCPTVSALLKAKEE